MVTSVVGCRCVWGKRVHSNLTLTWLTDLNWLNDLYFKIVSLLCYFCFVFLFCSSCLLIQFQELKQLIVAPVTYWVCVNFLFIIFCPIVEAVLLFQSYLLPTYPAQESEFGYSHFCSHVIGTESDRSFTESVGSTQAEAITYMFNFYLISNCFLNWEKPKTTITRGRHPFKSNIWQYKFMNSLKRANDSIISWGFVSNVDVLKGPVFARSGTRTRSVSGCFSGQEQWPQTWCWFSSQLLHTQLQMAPIHMLKVLDWKFQHDSHEKNLMKKKTQLLNIKGSNQKGLTSFKAALIQSQKSYITKWWSNSEQLLITTSNN